MAAVLSTPAPPVRLTWQVHLDPSFSLLQGRGGRSFTWTLRVTVKNLLCVCEDLSKRSIISLKRGQDLGMGLESLKCKGKQGQHQ